MMERKVLLMTECVLFDMDGTLINSMPLWTNIASDFVREMGFEPRENLYDILYGKTLEDSSRYIRDMYELDMTDDEALAAIIALVEEKYKLVNEKSGALAFVKELKARGIKTAVVSACPEPLVVPTLNRLGFAEYLDAIYYSTDKSTPDVFLRLADEIGYTPDNTWLFEDNLTAMVAAKKAGLHTATLYEESNITPESEFKQKTDRFYKEFSNLDGLLSDIL